MIISCFSQVVIKWEQNIEKVIVNAFSWKRKETASSFTMNVIYKASEWLELVAW